MALLNYVSNWRAKVLEPAVTGLLDRMGAAGAQRAKELVSVDTGQTRDSIGYVVNQSTKTVQIYADTSWAIFLEFGTSRMPAKPFLRPALMSLRGFKLTGATAEIGLQARTPKTPVAPITHAGTTRVKVRRYDPHRPLS